MEMPFHPDVRPRERETGVYLEPPSLSAALRRMQASPDPEDDEDNFDLFWRAWSVPFRNANEAVAVGNPPGLFLGEILAMTWRACARAGCRPTLGRRFLHRTRQAYRSWLDRENTRSRYQVNTPPSFESFGALPLPLLTSPIDWSDPLAHLPWASHASVPWETSHSGCFAFLFLLSILLMEGAARRPAPVLLWIPVEPLAIQRADKICADAWTRVWGTGYQGVRVDPDLGVTQDWEGLRKYLGGSWSTHASERLKARELLRAFAPEWQGQGGDANLIGRIMELLDESRGVRAPGARKTKRKGAAQADTYEAQQWVDDQAAQLQRTPNVNRFFIQDSQMAFSDALTDALDPGRVLRPRWGTGPSRESFNSHVRQIADALHRALTAVDAGGAAVQRWVEAAMAGIKAALPVREGAAPPRVGVRRGW